MRLRLRLRLWRPRVVAAAECDLAMFRRLALGGETSLSIGRNPSSSTPQTAMGHLLSGLCSSSSSSSSSSYMYGSSSSSSSTQVRRKKPVQLYQVQ